MEKSTQKLCKSLLVRRLLNEILVLPAHKDIGLSGQGKKRIRCSTRFRIPQFALGTFYIYVYTYHGLREPGISGETMKKK